MFWSFRGFFCLLFAFLFPHLHHSVNGNKMLYVTVHLKHIFSEFFLSSIDTSYRKMKVTMELRKTLEVVTNKTTKYEYGSQSWHTYGYNQWNPDSTFLVPINSSREKLNLQPKKLWNLLQSVSSPEKEILFQNWEKIL